MSAVVDRALTAAANHDYTGPETRVLLRMAMDADHETGENCTSSLARLHDAGGYADDRGRFRSARRTIGRLEGDGAIRCDLDVAGIGRLFTVCPTGAWSASVAARTALGRKLAAWHRRHSTPDVKTSGDPRTNGPTTSLTSTVSTGRGEGAEVIDFATKTLTASLSMDRKAATP